MSASKCISMPSWLARSCRRSKQGAARTAAESVAADAEDVVLVVDGDVVPIGEILGDRPVALRVVALEGLQRLVGKHHAEAKCVVRLVALVHRDACVRSRLLHQDREIQARRAAADYLDTHDRSSPCAPSGPFPGELALASVLEIF
jgi:hypothetical protein